MCICDMGVILKVPNPFFLKDAVVITFSKVFKSFGLDQIFGYTK